MCRLKAGGSVCLHVHVRVLFCVYLACHKLFFFFSKIIVSRQRSLCVYLYCWVHYQAWGIPLGPGFVLVAYYVFITVLLCDSCISVSDCILYIVPYFGREVPSIFHAALCELLLVVTLTTLFCIFLWAQATLRTSVVSFAYEVSALEDVLLPTTSSFLGTNTGLRLVSRVIVCYCILVFNPLTGEYVWSIW